MSSSGLARLGLYPADALLRPDLGHVAERMFATMMPFWLLRICQCGDCASMAEHQLIHGSFPSVFSPSMRVRAAVLCLLSQDTLELGIVCPSLILDGIIGTLVDA